MIRSIFIFQSGFSFLSDGSHHQTLCGHRTFAVIGVLLSFLTTKNFSQFCHNFMTISSRQKTFHNSVSILWQFLPNNFFVAILSQLCDNSFLIKKLFSILSQFFDNSFTTKTFRNSVTFWWSSLCCNHHHQHYLSPLWQTWNFIFVKSYFLIICKFVSY